MFKLVGHSGELLEAFVFGVNLLLNVRKQLLLLCKYPAQFVETHPSRGRHYFLFQSGKFHFRLMIAQQSVKAVHNHYLLLIRDFILNRP